MLLKSLTAEVGVEVVLANHNRVVSQFPVPFSDRQTSLPERENLIFEANSLLGCHLEYFMPKTQPTVLDRPEEGVRLHGRISEISIVPDHRKSAFASIPARIKSTSATSSNTILASR
jgi:hypothetical protein